MDLVTQGLLGTAIALSVAKPDEIKQAGIIGLIAGLAADVDFFIRSNSDPLLNLEFHRHFTHSLFFIPVAALIISFLLWPFSAQGRAYAGTNTWTYVGRTMLGKLSRPWMATSSDRHHLPWKRIFTYSLAGYLLSGLLDACTSYGTRLLWPLSEDKISFNIISIIDPVFTLSLLLGVLLTIKYKKLIFVYSFLIIAASYLFLGWWQHDKVEQLSQQLAKQRGHQIENLLVKPTLGNLFLWRSVYLYQDYYYVDAIRLSPINNQSTIFPGSSIMRFHAYNHEINIKSNSVLQKDIERFSSFSSDYLALHPQQENIIIDVRYANLPNSTLPLWGIQFDPEKPDQHASYNLYRDSSKATRQRFFSMLFNQEVTTEAPKS